ncbi:ATP/GTP-binding protein [Streptomonospora sp. S1-112]|uniref:ATP/GTP-binding protein n=1 Tax=Streptomonospora mangrovi TaxID=2883123 RepID=A0A9X3NNB2_9ACTN|nr:ATP/GTP-binding protein [Streptomonospora mangrovi]MDA0565201.1 ATP/GTP-binding protein [Streptomonospora mangrovi]
MRSSASELAGAVKLVVAGSPGAGKTSLIRSVSDIDPVRTEEKVSLLPHDGPSSGSETTTVALDYGRLQLNTDLLLAVFGLPGAARFRFLWEDLARGAVGAAVLACPAALADAAPAVSFLEERGLPFVVVVNDDGRELPTADTVRGDLALDAGVPVVLGDVRRPPVGFAVVRDVVRTALRHHSQAPALAGGGR